MLVFSITIICDGYTEWYDFRQISKLQAQQFVEISLISEIGFESSQRLMEEERAWAVDEIKRRIIWKLNCIEIPSSWEIIRLEVFMGLGWHVHWQYETAKWICHNISVFTIQIFPIRMELIHIQKINE